MECESLCTWYVHDVLAEVSMWYTVNCTNWLTNRIPPLCLKVHALNIPRVGRGTKSYLFYALFPKMVMAFFIPISCKESRVRKNMKRHTVDFCGAEIASRTLHIPNRHPVCLSSIWCMIHFKNKYLGTQEPPQSLISYLRLSHPSSGKGRRWWGFMPRLCHVCMWLLPSLLIFQFLLTLQPSALVFSCL